MNSEIKVIVFDFGGVLIGWDPRNLYSRFFPEQPQAMEDFLAEVSFMEWNAQQDKGRPFTQGIAILSQQFPHYSQLIQAYYDHWIDSVKEPIAGAVSILKRLKQRGYSLYGLSNWSTETYPHARQRFDFFGMFDGVVLSGAVGHVKPEPEIYQIMLAKTGRPAQECLLIDDSLANIHQAQKMGFAVIHFQSAGQLENDLHGLELL